MTKHQSPSFILFLFFLLVFVGCSSLSSEQKEQLRDLGEDAATRVKEDGPSAAATAKVLGGTVAAKSIDAGSALATKVVEDGPSAAATAKVLSATAAVQAQAVAETIREDGPSAVSTIRAYGTPVITLKARLNSLFPDNAGNVYINVTEGELTTALTWDEANDGEDAGNFRNVRALIRDGNIVLMGDVVNPMPATATVVFEPYLIDETVQFKVVEANVGRIDMPRVVLNSAESRFNNTLILALKLVPGDIQYLHVSATDGALTILGNVRR